MIYFTLLEKFFVYFFKDQNSDSNLSNLGYAVLNENGHSLLRLRSKDEKDRFSLQLYHHLATGFGVLNNLFGKTVLDISCGKGGGLRFIQK